MKKIPAILLTLFTLCGCMIHWNDDAAVCAVREYRRFAGQIPDFPVTLGYAVTRTSAENDHSLRRDFALLHKSEQLTKLYRTPLQSDKLRQVMLDAACARISLNTRLGFLPEAGVRYDSSGSFAVPAELPDRETLTKAVLVNCRNDMDKLQRLRHAHLAHARAVAAYDRAAHVQGQEARIQTEYDRVICCIDLAEAVGIPFTALENLAVDAGRFDTAERKMNSAQ